MSRARAALFLAITMLTGCMRSMHIINEEGLLPPPAQDWTSPAKDCSAAATLPQGSTRVYIAFRNGKDGSGKSADDARDGSTVTAFDTVLRCYSEGCTDAAHPQKSVAKTENLIVCIGPGTFSTLGSYDYMINVPHANPAGFTIGKGWKIHGAGKYKTTLKLSDYLPNTEGKNPQNFPLDTGIGRVFYTNSDGASNIEISDLGLDANYPDLKSRARQNGIKALTLEAIWLRSQQGGHWIHDISVRNVAGEIGGIDIRWEAFHILIINMNNNDPPSKDSGNLVENVTMEQAFGNTGCGIVVGNALAEVRHNTVQGFPIGYGGWLMGEDYFHDNTATDTEYGFNVDSWSNNGVRIESNHFVHPRKFGIVAGGDQKFTNFKILNNTVQMQKADVIGLVLRGGVTASTIAGNTFVAENSSGARSTAMRVYSAARKVPANANNIYQSNQFAGGMRISFEAPSQRAQNCFFGNHDENGRPLKDLPDNHNGPCVDLPAAQPARK